MTDPLQLSVPAVPSPRARTSPSRERRTGSREAGEQVSALLALKVAPPRVPPSTIRRPRLSALLEKGTNGPVTLVSAGPGAGKTLAVAAWAIDGGAPGPVAWLALDETDNDPTTFWLDLLTSLKRSGGLPITSQLHDLVPAGRFGAAEFDRVRAGIAELAAPLVLVLDDLHEIAAPAVLADLGRLLDRPLPSLRVVMLARADPALRLHRLRVGGHLTEVRWTDLAFDGVETDELFAQHGLSLTPVQRRTLLDKTEGWAAALRLAAMSLDTEDLDRGIAQFSGDERSVAEYLVGEVLADQPASVRDFLLRASVADRLTGPLADALTDRADGARMLEQLARDNALVLGFDQHHEWFRYHPLLRDLLLHQLMAEDPSAIPKLHRRAAAWFAERGAPIDSIRHAASAGDRQLVLTTLVTDALPFILTPQAPALVAALRPVAAQVRFDPTVETLICAIACYFHDHAFRAMSDALARARRLVGPSGSGTDPLADIALTMFEIADARFSGDMDVLVDRGRQVTKLLDGTELGDMPAAPYYRVVAEVNKGVAQLWLGNYVDAEALLLAACEQTDQLGLELPHLTALAHLALIDFGSGRLRAASDRASTAMRLAMQRGWASELQMITAFTVLALINLEWNNLPEATRVLNQGLATSIGRTDRVAHLALLMTQVRLQVTRRDVNAAMAAMALLRKEAAIGHPPPDFVNRLIALIEADVHLLANAPALAVALIDQESLSADSQADRERLCLARGSLALGATLKAEELLRPLRQRSAADLGTAVEGWLVTALTADRLRQDNAAIQAMTRALELAEPEGIRRPFLVLASRVSTLLIRQQHLVGSSAELATEILADLSTTSQPTPLPLEERLTERELTLLRYLPTMLSNQEIGSDLYISVNTVKAHLKALYRKLGVGNRREAVSRARGLGLL